MDRIETSNGHKKSLTDQVQSVVLGIVTALTLGLFGMEVFENGTRSDPSFGRDAGVSPFAGRDSTPEAATLAALEQRLDARSDAAAVRLGQDLDAVYARLDDIELALANVARGADSDVPGLTRSGNGVDSAELSQVRSQGEQARALLAADIADVRATVVRLDTSLTGRLAALETAAPAAGTPGQLDARLGALETGLETLSTSTDARLAQLAASLAALRQNVPETVPVSTPARAPDLYAGRVGFRRHGGEVFTSDARFVNFAELSAFPTRDDRIACVEVALPGDGDAPREETFLCLLRGEPGG